MHTVILVGWNYQEDRIPVWLDILRVCDWYTKALKCEFRIVIISDNLDRFTSVMSSVTLRYAINSEQLIRELLTYVSGNVTFYYSGHGVKGSMLLPSEQKLSWESIYELLLRKSNHLTLILDCCASPIFDTLSYRYVSGWNLYSPVVQSIRKILVFTPSVDRSAVSAEGSLFTRQIINCFSNQPSYSNMELHGILIQSNTPHPPYYNPSFNIRYERSKMYIQFM